MQVIEASIPAVLRERAHLQPNDSAFTFMDYDSDPGGRAETLTWAEVYHRSRALAAELAGHSRPGDRAAILAPQGLDYVIALLGALEAGLVAVPLAAPFGPGDEHVSAVLGDSSPTVVLTTSSAAANVDCYLPDAGRPTVVAIDSLALQSSGSSGAHTGRECPIAYLQYTSGSTREPAGVVVSHRNLVANYDQVMSDYFVESGGVAPPDTTVVSWVPLSHNMGLFIGVCAPILAGLHSVLLSPIAFVQHPARWMQLLARHSRAFSPAPNFALELAARVTSDEEMAGLDLGNVFSIICGGERVNAATIRRFADRFARCGLSESVIRPSYGLAEATVYVATRRPGEPPKVAHFDPARLRDGYAERCAGDGTALVSYGQPRSPAVRIVDPGTGSGCVEGTVGELWVHGDNVASGYWRKPGETHRTFGGRVIDTAAGEPTERWLRTGDLGAICDGELFVMGRLKDVLIVYGRNHYPDDIEATIHEVAEARAAAISVPDAAGEKLVAIVELDNPTDTVKNAITSAISTSHGLTVADLVVVSPGSIPTTRSGKVRRQACVDRYRTHAFARVDG